MSTVTKDRTVTVGEWREEARALFGDDAFKWRFVCPSCGHVASVQDWKDAGASEGQVAYSCVGRALGSKTTMCNKPGPCNYAGGGLIGLNPVNVVSEDGGVTAMFEFDKPIERVTE